MHSFTISLKNSVVRSGQCQIQRHLTLSNTLQSNEVLSKIESKICPLCKKKLDDKDSLETHLAAHKKKVNYILRKNPLETYGVIFGEHKIKHINDYEIRWPDGLIVDPGHCEGSKRGLWYDFKNDIGGTPVDAVAYVHQKDETEAIKMACEKFGINASNVDNFESPYSSTLPLRVNSDKVTPERINHCQKTEESAIELWNMAEPINGTVGFEYLRMRRKIPHEIISTLEFKFLNSGAMYRKWNKKDRRYEKTTIRNPILLVPIENVKCEITGVQRIYLDRVTFKKAFEKSKFTLGNMKGNIAIIRRGNPDAEEVIIAEGPETAASIACIAKYEKVPILASLSIGNLKTLPEIIKQRFNPQTVIIAADNDCDQKIPNPIMKLSSALKDHGIKVNIRIPRLEKEINCHWNHFHDEHERIAKEFKEDIKCDWNDILIHNGPEIMAKMFERNITVL